MGSTRRKFYAEQLAAKQEELAMIQEDLETCSNRKQELKLKKEAERVLKDIDDLEAKLLERDLNSDEANKVIAIDKTLRKVDFSVARQIASDLKMTFESQDGGSALLLLQRTAKQMGNYCLYEVLHTIFEYEMQEILLQKQKSSACKVYTANLANIATGSTPLGCLSLLLGYEGQFASQDLKHLEQEFRRSLCDALRSGDRVLILVEDWHYVEPAIFLKWFVEEFWKPLLDEIKRCVLPEYGRIRVVAVLASSGQLAPECLAEVPFCSLDEFREHHLIELPLPDWTIDDIQKWFMDVKQLGRSESLRLARQLHLDSEGTPQTICSKLKEQYSA